jgi:heme a synthase
MTRGWPHRLLRAACVLAVIVVGASSYLRLAGNGLGCEPWPACYGTTATLEHANQSTLVQALRLAHRGAASLFLLLVIAATVLGWARWQRAQRAQAVVLLVVTAALAAIGRLTPSPLPWITWFNVLGGFALIGLTLQLSSAPHADERPHGRRTQRAIAVLLVLVVLQVVGGTLLSVRLAAAECQPACMQPARGGLLALWDPVRAGSATALAGNGGAPMLHGMHRLGGLLLALAALGVVGVAPGGAFARSVAGAAVALVMLGFTATHMASAGIGAAHALVAAFLLAALALSWRARSE